MQSALIFSCVLLGMLTQEAATLMFPKASIKGHFVQAILREFLVRQFMSQSNFNEFGEIDLLGAVEDETYFSSTACSNAFI